MVKTKSQRMLKSKPLKKGSHIALAAPSSHFRKEHFDAALAYLTTRGYSITYQDGVFARETYLAGSDERRLSELSDYLKDPEIDGIFLLRGGFGAARMFKFPIKPFKVSHPKIVMGMSDHTFILNQLARKNHLVTVHAPIITSEMFRVLPDKQKDRVFDRLENKGKQVLKEGADFQMIQAGNASGKLWGGNLSMLQTTFGTPFENSWKKGILFLEDTNEMEYRLDRIFAHLYLTGHLKEISGLILGDFTDKDNNEHSLEFIQRIVKRYVPSDIPVLAKIKAGHRHGDVVLPIGGNVSIKQQGRTLEIDSIV
ncbi:MAG: LD-carboxypeptidase [Proteobacteria bacterium]|jgi:muramoyltetrapeptide carboxypeptidase|nr:LD-carboxypeptidase [Pseudomonadota bacterium]